VKDTMLFQRTDAVASDADQRDPGGRVARGVERAVVDVVDMALDRAAGLDAAAGDEPDPLLVLPTRRGRVMRIVVVRVATRAGRGERVPPPDGEP
jgi:hypothetical protein